jgi:hypothetical protein
MGLHVRKAGYLSLIRRWKNAAMAATVAAAKHHHHLHEEREIHPVRHEEAELFPA